ncbi:MAG: signal peptide peptidase SppA [Candidatus Diapherotrites archaeon CG08_land_8_20_14_0_20_34_12]|nr:MAG: signal peptide peptidase SppA [Candidatus Diapherotrites archaeon CG08_land_8_20_14_0_20_34_12]
MDNKKIFLIIVVAVFMLIGLAVILSALFFPGTADSISLFLGNNIALVKIDSEISNYGSTFFPAKSAFDIVSEIEKADKDSSVSAILLEINSPGGSVVASKQIVEAVQNAKKPVISWISDEGASGAYLIAASSDYIMADSSSLTGSIGVISILPNYEGLMEKLGLKFEVLKQGKYKDIGNPFREMTAEEKKMFYDAMGDIFVEFKDLVKEFRKDKLNLKEFTEIADGRFLTGKQALDIGLIDALGSRKEAIEKAADLAGIKGEAALKDFSESDFKLGNLFSEAGYFISQGFISGLNKSNLSLQNVKIQ